MFLLAKLIVGFPNLMTPNLFKYFPLMCYSTENKKNKKFQHTALVLVFLRSLRNEWHSVSHKHKNQSWYHLRQPTVPRLYRSYSGVQKSSLTENQCMSATTGYVLGGTVSNLPRGTDWLFPGPIYHCPHWPSMTISLCQLREVALSLLGKKTKSNIVQTLFHLLKNRQGFVHNTLFEQVITVCIAVKAILCNVDTFLEFKILIILYRVFNNFSPVYIIPSIKAYVLDAFNSFPVQGMH